MKLVHAHSGVTETAPSLPDALLSHDGSKHGGATSYVCLPFP